MRQLQNRYYLFLTSIIIAFYVIPLNSIFAQTVDDLKSKISTKGDELRTLQAQINTLDKNVNDTVIKRRTLTSELKQIDAVKKKLETDVKITSTKIDISTLNISRLEAGIADKQSSIETGLRGLSSSIKLIRETDSVNIPMQILSGEQISVLWNRISQLQDFDKGIANHNIELKIIQSDLEKNKQDLETEKAYAIILKSQLSDQQKIVAQNVIQKNQLIVETKNQETGYKKMLAETQLRKAAVENELLQFESDLKVIIDPHSLPTSGTKVIAWPLANVFITQYFGDTAFARSHSVYNGKGHNGIDLRASIGTSLLSAGNGIVVGTGDTDPICYGASYGKWIMIDHQNGLATIYGHLSLIKVGVGDRVGAGDLIGYTGKTGYALGPHLHFTVAATQAVKIGNLKSKVMGCGTYTIPLGPFNGYLNPLLYL